MIPDRAWLDALPDAILVVDSSGIIVLANKRCESLAGWSAAELVGRPIEALVPPRFEAHATLRSAFAAAPALRAMGPGLETTILHRSGEEIPVDVALNAERVDGATYVLASVRDARAQSDLAERLRIQSVALDAAASGIVITTRGGIIVSVNPAACRMTGYAARELIGQRPSLLKSSEHDESFYSELWRTVLSGQTWNGSIINKRKDGTLYHEEQTIAPVRDRSGEITHFIAVKQDVTERVLAEQALRTTRDELARRVIEVEALHSRLRDQATRDPLTGLLNRRYLDETLPRELASARRGGSAVTLAVLDIDHFKHVNDHHGHVIGDLVLLELGRLLGGHSRTSDVACRYGGEEFVVVLKGARLADGLRRADEWRRAFGAVRVQAAGTQVHATMSAGVAEWQPGETADELFVRADAALFAAKRAGRNRTVAAEPPPALPVAGV